MPSSYTVGDHFYNSIQQQVEGGRYPWASEVTLDNLLFANPQDQQRRKAAISCLRGKIEKGC